MNLLEIHANEVEFEGCLAFRGNLYVHYDGLTQRFNSAAWQKINNETTVAEMINNLAWDWLLVNFKPEDFTIRSRLAQ